eukprot:COSAG05_NODE_8612_length_688_cov_0.517827_2_plen_165_part_00
MKKKRCLCTVCPEPVWATDGSLCSSGRQQMASHPPKNTETVSFQRGRAAHAPFHLLSIVLASTLKNAVLHWLATAFARIVLPVPGGPKRRIPLYGSRRPSGCGLKTGIIYDMKSLWTAQHRSGQVRSGQVRSGQAGGSGRVMTGQVGSGQVRQERQGHEEHSNR